MTRDVSDVTHRKRGLRFEKSVELSLAVRRRRVTFAYSPRPCGGCHTCLGGADEKVSIERLCLSSYVEKPLNSKVIKSFVPELRSRYVFYVLCIYVMNILSTFHISVSWVCYNQQHQHHQVALTALISLTLSLSLFMRPYHPSQLACLPNFILRLQRADVNKILLTHPYVGFLRRMSLKSSSLLLPTIHYKSQPSRLGL